MHPIYEKLVESPSLEFKTLIRIFCPLLSVSPIQLILMADTNQGGYQVEVVRIAGQGSAWIVRVYKKLFFCRKRVSSDWFVDGAQAERFAQRLRKDLALKETVQKLKERRPGWTLHRPDR